MSLREEGKDRAFYPSSKDIGQFTGFVFDASLLVCPLHSSDVIRENIWKVRSNISGRSTLQVHLYFISVEGWIKPTQEKNMSMSLAIRSADFLPNGCDQRPRGSLPIRKAAEGKMTPALFTGLHLINSAVGDVRKKKEVDYYNDVIHLVVRSSLQPYLRSDQGHGAQERYSATRKISHFPQIFNCVKI